MKLSDIKKLSFTDTGIKHFSYITPGYLFSRGYKSDFDPDNNYFSVLAPINDEKTGGVFAAKFVKGNIVIWYGVLTVPPSVMSIRILERSIYSQ